MACSDLSSENTRTRYSYSSTFFSLTRKHSGFCWISSETTRVFTSVFECFRAFCTDMCILFKIVFFPLKVMICASVSQNFLYLSIATWDRVFAHHCFEFLTDAPRPCTTHLNILHLCHSPLEGTFQQWHANPAHAKRRGFCRHIIWNIFVLIPCIHAGLKYLKT